MCLAHATLIAFNSYPAWYGGTGDPTPTPTPTPNPNPNPNPNPAWYGGTGDLREPARFWNEQAAAVFNGSTASGAAATVGKP